MIHRQSVLLGVLIGVLVGAGAGFYSGNMSAKNAVSSALKQVEGGKKESFAQQGEDLVVRNLLDTIGIRLPTYIDIGAHHPIINSNTFLFYKTGGKGVLVEPNPQYADLLREKRPNDTVLEVGVGITDQTEADYYMLGGDGQRNTFSKEQVDELTKMNGRDVVVKTIKRQLVNVNEILEKYFGGAGGAPDFLSIDVEGLDYAILQTLDFDKHRPKIVCVETCELDGTIHKGIVELLQKKGYEERGGSYVNTVWVDKKVLEGPKKGTRE